MEKDNLILFLIKYGGFSPDAAMDYNNALPNQSIDLANRIKKSILDDKMISEEKKAEILEYDF